LQEDEVGGSLCRDGEDVFGGCICILYVGGGGCHDVFQGTKSEFPIFLSINHNSRSWISGTRVMDPSIEAIDTRLRRLEYILTGSTSPVDTTLKPESQRTNIPNQLSSLNDRLAKLANANKSIKKLLQACTPPPKHPSPSNAR